MPAKFHLVSPGVWTRAFRNLDAATQVVAFNVWTCRNRVSEGLFELSPGHVAADTGLLVEDVDAALEQLHAANIINYDAEAEVVLDRAALKANPLRNGRDEKTGEVRPDRRIKPAVDLFTRVASTPLKAEFLALADEHSPDLSAAIRERLDLPAPERQPPASPFGGATQGPTAGARGGASPPSGSPSEGPTQGASRAESQRGEKLRSRESSSNGSSDLVKGETCPHCGDPVSGWCTKVACSNAAKSPPAAAMLRRMAGGAS